MIDIIRQKAEEIFPDVQAIRHHIHANPELSFEEYNTAEFISSKLTKYGIEHETGVAGTGVIGLVKGKNPDKKCIALRADMDALPIQEANEVAYKSKNDGVMHACGHDVHSSCLLGIAIILNDLKNEWEGTVKLIFQQGEEKHPGGASLLIKAGVLENPKPEAIFALHVYPHMPSGTVGFRAGQYMASTDEIYITIEGTSGHAALPHKAVDPIAIGAQVVTGLQQVVARKANPVSPTVLTFGKIEAGFATNVIPDKLELWGTLRCMNEDWRAEAHQLIKDFTTHTCEAYGAKATINIPKGHASLFNDPEVTNNAEGWAKQFLGEENVETLDIRMTGEDFSFYTLHMPGCFFRLGTNKNNEEFTASVHNAHFDIDEDALKTGVGTMTWIAINALSN